MQGAEGDAPRPLKSLFRRVARWNFRCSRSILRGFGGTHLFIRQFLHQDGRDDSGSISSFIGASFLCASRLTVLILPAQHDVSMKEM